MKNFTHIHWFDKIIIVIFYLLMASDVYAVYSGNDSFATIHYIIPIIIIYLFIECRD